MQGLDGEHNEKWKNKRPTLDDFGLTLESLEKNKKAHEQEIICNEEKERVSKETAAKVDAIGRDARIYLICIPLFTIIIAVLLYPFLFSIFDPDHSVIVKTGGVIMVALVFQCLPTGLLSWIDQTVRERKAYDGLRDERNAIDLKFRQEYEKWLDLDDLIEEYQKAIDDYDYWLERGKDYGELVEKNEGYDFELQVAGLLENKGYRVDLHYLGVDTEIIFHAYKDDEKYAVLCKERGDNVKVEDINDLIEIISDDNCDRGLFVSLVDYSDEAKATAEDYSRPIRFITRRDIMEDNW